MVYSTRTNVWSIFLMPREPNKSLTLQEIREVIEKHKEKGRKIVADLQRLQGHYVKMQEYYSAWEDELDDIQKLIDEAAKANGIDPDAVEEFDALADALGD